MNWNWREACGDEQCDVCKRLLSMGEEYCACPDSGTTIYKCEPCMAKEEDELIGRCDADDVRYNDSGY